MTDTESLPATGAPRLDSLLRSEIRRARSRRSLPWLAGLAVLGVVGVAAIMWFTTAYVSLADLRMGADRFIADQRQYQSMCLEDPSLTEEAKTAGACDPPSETDALGNAIWYLPHQPFSQTSLEGLLTLAGGIGMLVCLMVAATTGGADWGARTMGLLLSWEPRRTRVYLVRLAVVVAIGVILEALLVLLAFGLGALIGNSHGMDPAVAAVVGDYGNPPVDLGAGWELTMRWVPLAALATTGSFAVAMLTRSTGWAIGVSIGFVAVVESVIQGVWAWGSQWLIQTNIAAWLQGGITKLVDRGHPNDPRRSLRRETWPPGTSSSRTRAHWQRWPPS